MLQADFNGFIYENVYPLGNNIDPIDIAVGDFNNDGILDIAIISNNNVSNNASLSVYLGNGDGTFYEMYTGDIPSFVASSLVVGQFTQEYDDYLSIVVAGYSITNTDGAIVPFIGTGYGTFTQESLLVIPASQGLNGIAFGKFDLTETPCIRSHRQHVLDTHAYNNLAVTASGGHIYILPGDGDGGFTIGASYSAGETPVGIATGVLTDSGNLDIVVANSADSTISILFGNGDGTFQHQIKIGVPNYPINIILADVNCDGILDIIAGGESTNSCPVGLFIGNPISVLIGDGAGNFQLTPSAFSTTENLPIGPGLAAGHFFSSRNKSPRQDHCAIDLAITVGDNLQILKGCCNGTFEITDVIYTTGGSPVAIATGDFTGNGLVDFAVVNELGSSFTVLIQNVSAPDLKGKSIKTKFLSQTEYTNELYWNSSKDSSVVGYYLYRDGKRIATISAGSPLEYSDYYRRPGVHYLYELRSFNGAKQESAPSCLILTP